MGYLHSSLDGSVQGGGQSGSFRAHGCPQVMQGQSCSHTYVMLCYFMLRDAMLHPQAIVMIVVICPLSMAEESMSTAKSTV